MNTINLPKPIESITALLENPLSMEELLSFFGKDGEEVKEKCDIITL